MKLATILLAASSAAVSAALVLCPGPAQASTVLALEEGDLARRVDAVVFGKVITTRTLKSATSAQMVTEADFQIYVSVKGPAVRQVIKVQVPGGTYGGIVQAVSGSPTVRDGDLYVGFLTQAGPRHFTPWGMGFGLRKVVQGPQGRLVVTPDLAGLTLLGPSGDDFDEPETLEPIGLDAYLSRLRGHLLQMSLPPPGWSGPEGDATTGVAP